jgi:hypothetical protein
MTVCGNREIILRNESKYLMYPLTIEWREKEKPHAHILIRFAPATDSSITCQDCCIRSPICQDNPTHSSGRDGQERRKTETRSAVAAGDAGALGDRRRRTFRTDRGARAEYDYKEIKKLDGALMVSLEIDDVSQEYDFQRRHLTNLIITPGGKFFVYNVKFVSEFARPKA